MSRKINHKLFEYRYINEKVWNWCLEITPYGAKFLVVGYILRDENIRAYRLFPEMIYPNTKVM